MYIGGFFAFDDIANWYIALTLSRRTKIRNKSQREFKSSPVANLIALTRA